MKNAAGALMLITCLATPLRGQAKAGIVYGFGFAEGTRDQHVMLDVSARFRAVDRLFLTGGFEVFGSFEECLGVACGYDGGSMAIGIALAALDTDRVFYAFGVDFGVFGRNGGEPEYKGGWHPTWSGSVATEVRIAGPLALQAAAFYRQVEDGVYMDVVGDAPTFIGMSIGLGLQVNRRRDGS